MGRRGAGGAAHPRRLDRGRRPGVPLPAGARRGRSESGRLHTQGHAGHRDRAALRAGLRPADQPGRRGAAGPGRPFAGGPAGDGRGGGGPHAEPARPADGSAPAGRRPARVAQERRPGDHGGHVPLLHPGDAVGGAGAPGAGLRAGASDAAWSVRGRRHRIGAGARGAGGRRRRAPQRRGDRDRHPRRARAGDHLRLRARPAGHAARRRRGLRGRLAARGSRGARARAGAAFRDRPSGGRAPAGDRRGLRDLLPVGSEGAPRPGGRARTGRPRHDRAAHAHHRGRRGHGRRRNGGAAGRLAGDVPVLRAQPRDQRAGGPCRQRHLHPRGDGHVRPGPVLAARAGRRGAAAGPAGLARPATGADRPPRHAPGGGPGHRGRLRRGPRPRRLRPALDRPWT